MNLLIYLLTILLIPNISARNYNNNIHRGGRCLRTKHHLKVPQRNVKLHGECAPWSELTCCSLNESILSHQEVNQLHFNITHCGQDAISPECYRYFVLDLCYYNCDPFIEPWIHVEDGQQERIFQAPLCESDCVEWWNRCAETSYTCVRNWRKHFVWPETPSAHHNQKILTQRINKCPDGAKCQLFKHVYKDAYDFCQTVWDNSWKVVEDIQKCVSIKFDQQVPDPKNGFIERNPNQMVAEYYLNQQMTANLHIDLIWLLLELILLVFVSYYIVKCTVGFFKSF